MSNHQLPTHPSLSHHSTSRWPAGRPPIDPLVSDLPIAVSLTHWSSSCWPASRQPTNSLNSQSLSCWSTGLQPINLPVANSPVTVLLTHWCVTCWSTSHRLVSYHVIDLLVCDLLTCQSLTPRLLSHWPASRCPVNPPVTDHLDAILLTHWSWTCRSTSRQPTGDPPVNPPVTDLPVTVSLTRWWFSCWLTGRKPANLLNCQLSPRWSAGRWPTSHRLIDPRVCDLSRYMRSVVAFGTGLSKTCHASCVMVGTLLGFISMLVVAISLVAPEADCSYKRLLLHTHCLSLGKGDFILFVQLGTSPCWVSWNNPRSWRRPPCPGETAEGNHWR